MFQEQASSCVLVGVLTGERVSGACLRSKLLRVYWLEYLLGSVFWERVSGASSLVCTGLKSASGYGPGDPNPLADLDRGVQIRCDTGLISVIS